jgi:hypothetical protein
MGIAAILTSIVTFGNFHWDILLNQFEDSPFFTSDYPAVFEKTKDPRIFNRVIPLAPNLAIRICPDIMFDRDRAGYSFTNFTHTVRKLSRSDVTNINRLIVRCAETIVFFREDHDWIAKFVKKNAGYRIEPITRRLPHGSGTLLLFTQEISETLTRSDCRLTAGLASSP